jgi:4-hydroxy-tetrahydrodipicolinate reductase
MIRLAIIGASGRLGQLITAHAAADPRFELTALLVAQGSALHAQPSSVGGLTYAATLDRAADVIIDVSVPTALARTINLASAARAALVCGVTGFDAPALASLARLAQTHAVLHTHNFSRGVVVLKHLSTLSAKLLGPSVDVGVLDIHHRHKRDAPSGTAISLEAALRAGGATEVQHAALRLGTVVGEHQVQFAAAAEEIILTHRALDRAVFALGALDAAAWIAGKAPGQYAIESVFGIVTL